LQIAIINKALDAVCQKNRQLSEEEASVVRLLAFP
jgi:hypothetical protein